MKLVKSLGVALGFRRVNCVHTSILYIIYIWNGNRMGCWDKARAVMMGLSHGRQTDPSSIIFQGIHVTCAHMHAYTYMYTQYTLYFYVHIWNGFIYLAGTGSLIILGPHKRQPSANKEDAATSPCLAKQVHGVAWQKSLPCESQEELEDLNTWESVFLR